MSLLTSQRFQQDEAFIKAQLVAFCKALNKAEAPLKQKHVRALIVGTHRQRSARIFWHAVSRVQLEKNPVLTWKFCHLLHKLIRDGHRKVAEDSYSHCSRLVQLGNFWQHLRTSGYGQANTAYCKLLVSRLKFHKKYPSIPGSLQVSPNQLEALTTDMNETYEWAVDVLDQMDESLNLKTTGIIPKLADGETPQAHSPMTNSVTGIMDSLRWSSLVPQGQCLLAPLIVVIIDTSKYYDFLVKALFKLHSALPADTLVGHRERFYEMFRKTKKFYEEASSLQYFKYLVSLPTLPSVAPNFLHASDLDIYESPQAYLHEQMSEAGETTPPDAQSLVSDDAISTIVDLSMPNMEHHSMPGASSSTGVSAAGANAGFDKRDEFIATLQHDLEMERETKEQLIQLVELQMKEQLIHEARSRIGQYENRLVQMKQEIDLHKQAADERREELVALRSSTENHQQQQQSAEEMERRVQDKEQKFAKMKTIYENLREEHIKALTEIRELRSSADDSEAALRAKSDEVCQITTELQTKSVMLEAEVEELKEGIEALNRDHAEERERVAVEADAQLKECQTSALRGVCAAASDILEQSQEDLQNATSVSYPAHLAANALRVPLEQAENKLLELIEQRAPSEQLLEANILFAHKLAESSVNCASAAYTASIPHFEPVNEQSRKVISLAQRYFQNLGDTNWHEAEKLLADVKAELAEMEKLVKALPTGTGDVDLETVGSQLSEEMRMMEAAIQQAVAKIEQMQKNAREKDSGVRLEVNEKILDSCNSLMSAVRLLVSRSRDVQGEIVALGRGTASTDEFYKRNHLWTEGLLSAARAVGVAATVLVSSADGLISGKGKFEQLIVAAQEIGASVAQLFVSSRVKAERDSKKLAELGNASKSVNACTAEVVAAVKSGQQSLSDEKLLDFTHFTLHEAKTKEMESQVRTLELEAELQRERAKLGALRKQHYHLASLVAANKEGENGTG